jgi:hypothetical protein
LIILNLKPFYDSALAGDLTPFDEFYIQLQQEIKLNDKNGVLIVADCADNLFRNKHFDQCDVVEKWWQDVYIKWLQPQEKTRGQDQNHVINVICPHSGSLLSRHPFDQHKHQLSHNHSIIIDIGSDKMQQAKRTEVLHGTQDVIDAEVRFFSHTKRRIDTCMNYTRPPLAIGIEQIRKAFLDAKSRGVRLSYLTEITIDNISYCKVLIKIVDELRHLDGIKGNFMISECEYLAPVILDEEGKIASQLIYSNVDQIVEQQHYMFETLWSKAI